VSTVGSALPEGNWPRLRCPIVLSVTPGCLSQALSTVVASSSPLLLFSRLLYLFTSYDLLLYRSWLASSARDSIYTYKLSVKSDVSAAITQSNLLLFERIWSLLEL